MSKPNSYIQTIDQLLATLPPIKTAESNTEAGGQSGGSAHPSADVEDNTRDATEGERSRENEQDVKQNVPAAVVGDSVATKTQDDVQPNIGLTQSATGEAPSIETDSAKGGKEDSGSSHPARTDNDSLNGGKYASDIRRFRKHLKISADLSNDLLAGVVLDAASNAVDTSGPKGQVGVVGTNKTATATEAAISAAVATEKAAQDAEFLANQVVSDLRDTIVVAYKRAFKTADFLSSLSQQLKKAEAPFEQVAEPAAAAGDQQLSPEELELLSALTQGGAGSAGGSESIEQGKDMDAAELAAPAADAEGANDDEDSSGNEEDELAMLQQILSEANISPDEVEAAAAKQAQVLASRVKSAAALHPARKSAWKPTSQKQARRAKAMGEYIRNLVAANR